MDTESKIIKVIQCCRINDVKSLKEMNFSLLDTDNNKEFPLHVAVSNNSVDVVKYLVTFPEIGEAINRRTRNRFKQCPLHIAAQKCDKNPEIIDILIEHGANVNEKDGDFNQTPLHEAAYYNNPNCLKCLLKHGAKVLIGNYHSFSPLQRASVGTECHSILGEFTKKELEKINHVKYKPKPRIPRINDDESLIHDDESLIHDDESGISKESEKSELVNSNELERAPKSRAQIPRINDDELLKYKHVTEYHMVKIRKRA